MRISDWSSDVCSSDLNHISPVAHSDTAGAAAWVADSDEVGLAALAPPHAADLYGLTLHGTGMEDADHNMTRFVVLAREPLAVPPAGVPLMTTFLFEVKRSEERRGGKACGSTCRYRWAPDH